MEAFRFGVIRHWSFLSRACGRHDGAEENVAAGNEAGLLQRAARWNVVGVATRGRSGRFRRYGLTARAVTVSRKRTGFDHVLRGLRHVVQVRVLNVVREGELAE